MTEDNSTKQLVADLLKQSTASAAQREAADEHGHGSSDDSSEEDDELSQQARLSTLLPFPSRMDANDIDDQEALTAIELFFDSEDPIERDLLVEQLSANPSGHAREFFVAAMGEDPDPYIQSQAAEALIRRGDPNATKFLYDIIADPEDLTLLNHAIQVLSHVQGESFMDVLVTMWHDEERSAEEHREAIIGLENLSPGKALELFKDYVRSISDADHLSDDELALIMTIFVRHDCSDVVSDLQALRDRVSSTPDVDEEDIELILEEIDSTIELLSE